MSDWADEEAEKLFLRILGRTLHDTHAEIAGVLRAAHDRGLAARPNLDTVTALAREIARLGGELRTVTQQLEEAQAAHGRTLDRWKSDLDKRVTA